MRPLKRSAQVHYLRCGTYHIVHGIAGLQSGVSDKMRSFTLTYAYTCERHQYTDAGAYKFPCNEILDNEILMHFVT